MLIRNSYHCFSTVPALLAQETSQLSFALLYDQQLAHHDQKQATIHCTRYILATLGVKSEQSIRGLDLSSHAEPADVQAIRHLIKDISKKYSRHEVVHDLAHRALVALPILPSTTAQAEPPTSLFVDNPALQSVSNA